MKLAYLKVNRQMSHKKTDFCTEYHYLSLVADLAEMCQLFLIVEKITIHSTQMSCC